MENNLSLPVSNGHQDIGWSKYFLILSQQNLFVLPFMERQIRNKYQSMDISEGLLVLDIEGEDSVMDHNEISSNSKESVSFTGSSSKMSKERSKGFFFISD